jgi:tRNA (adenine57-N1/adenine58-N1)-methyltransferase
MQMNYNNNIDIDVNASESITNNSTIIQEGSYVLLHYVKRSWLVKVEKSKVMHTHIGIIDVGSIIGKSYGSYIESSLGKRVYLLKPLVYDIVMKGERRTQIVYPKDMGYIASRLGLQSGVKVLEIGLGSGALTTFIAGIVKPSGHVYSYEVRDEFIPIAKRNLSKLGLEDYVTIINKDAKDGIDVKDIDAAVIDMGEPWSVVSNVYNALKGSAPICAICPTMNQLERLATALRSNNFIDLEFTEIMIRHIEAREGMSRPMFRMIGHTAYLAFARKVYA